jgi:hypothetical protein
MANFEVLALNNSRTQETQWTREAGSWQVTETRGRGETEDSWQRAAGSWQIGETRGNGDKETGKNGAINAECGMGNAELETRRPGDPKTSGVGLQLHLPQECDEVSRCLE